MTTAGEQCTLASLSLHPASQSPLNAGGVLSCPLYPDLTPTECRQLLALVADWDVAGDGRLVLEDLQAALRMCAIKRVPLGTIKQHMAAEAAAAGRPGSAGAGRLRMPGPRQQGEGAGGGGTGGLREVQLRERVAALEAELSAARQQQGVRSAGGRGMVGSREGFGGGDYGSGGWWAAACFYWEEVLSVGRSNEHASFPVQQCKAAHRRWVWTHPLLKMQLSF